MRRRARPAIAAAKRRSGARLGFDEIHQVIFPPYWINMIPRWLS
jgi:hypothetical protein